MDYDRKTKEELIRELKELKQRFADLDATQSDIRQSQANLLSGETFFRTLIENSLDIITILDGGGIFLYQSPNVEQMLGYLPKELIGKNAFEYIHHEDILSVMDTFNYVVGNPGASRSVAYRFRSKDGSWRHFESVGKLLPVKVKGLGVVINSRDITDRKHAERALLTSERRLRRAEEVANFGNWEFLMDDKIVRASDGARIIYGLGCKVWQISDVQNIPLPEYRTMLDQAMTELIEQGRPYNVEFKIRRPTDGVIIDIHSLAEYDAVSRIVFGVIHDITDRKRVEDELRKAHDILKGYSAKLEEEVYERTREAKEAQFQAESANRAKSEFLTNISHEFRTPLNAVIGFSEAMLGGLGGPLNAAQAEYIDYIDKGGKHLQRLIEDILDMSKIEAGKMELDMGEFLVKDLIDSSITMFKEKATRHGLMITSEVDEDIERMTADALMVKRVLCNLLSNAIKFTPEGGKVHIVAALRDNGEYVEFSVQDTGIGISIEGQGKLFQPFTQLDSSHTKKYEGTGLGLSLSRKIVELHGGNILIRSETGKGSNFYFTIPLHS